MPTLSDQELDETRRHYAAAALTLYRDGGVRAVTMRSVADRLSVSHTLVYRYFSNKNGLLAAARGLCFDALRHALMEAVTARNGTAEDNLVALIQAAVGWILDNPADYQLMYMLDNDPAAATPDLDLARLRLFETCVVVISTYLAEAGRDDDPAMLCSLGWAGIHGVVMLDQAGHLTGSASVAVLMQPMLQSVYRMTVPLDTITASAEDPISQYTNEKGSRAIAADGRATGRRNNDDSETEGAPPRGGGVSGRRRRTAHL